MGHPSQQAPSQGDHDAGHGHASAPTAEQVEERERSLAVERAIARAVARPLGPVLAIVGAGASLAFVGGLASGAPRGAWLWLLPSLLAMAWGLALTRSEGEPREG